MAQFPSQSSASGLWSLKKQKRAQQGSNWPPLYGPADDYFEYVTMLLPGNGTNGAQNNTFLDSSTNNFTITRNGNTTQGTFTPYGANWSNYFGGSSDYLSVPSSANLAFGTGDFCVEFWVYLGKTTQQGIFSNAVSSAGGDTQFEIQIFSSKFAFWGWNTNFLNSTTTVQANTYYHVAVVRSGTSMAMFVNGTREATTTSSNNFSSTNAFNIGRQAASTSYLQGYISNLRAVKGSSVYSPSSTSITVPTAPLTAITNTQLLTCQSNRFIDNSSNAYALTVTGSPSVQRFSPFNPTTPYAADVIGGSGYFDGSGDYLSATTAASLGSGDFTVECWVYFTSAPGADTGNIICSYNYYTAGFNGNAVFRLGTSYGGRIFNGQTLVAEISGTFTWPLYTWTHVAWVRSGSTITLYKNGVSIGSMTASTNLSDFANGFVVGASRINGTVGEYSTCYISNLRMVAGTAVYTTTFTPPTAPLTAITNTQLLLNMTNGGIIDNAMMNDLETVGNAQISTSVSKFGGGSLAFDGSGDALALPANINLAVGGGDFTIEMWVNGANNGSTVGGSYPRLFTFGTAQTSGCIECYNAAGTMYIEIFGVSSITFTASTLLNSTWNHYAITRSGTSLRAFVNGTQVGTTVTNSTNLNRAATTQSWIGAISASAGNFNGYIDDFRITKGYARYTANFTPPTQAFPTY